MQKSRQSINFLKVSDCSFCHSPSEEIRSLLKAVFFSLKKMFRNKKYSDHSQTKRSQDPSSIHRLLRILFEKQQFQMKFSKNCSHLKLLTLIRQKIGCRQNQLQTAIEQLCDRLARRNYELEIISLQNVENSVMQLEDSKQLTCKTKQESQISESIDKPVHQREDNIIETVKMEQLQQSQVCAGSPPTGINCNFTLENMPFAYNILYYGQSYYQ